MRSSCVRGRGTEASAEELVGPPLGAGGWSRTPVNSSGTRLTLALGGGLEGPPVQVRKKKKDPAAAADDDVVDIRAATGGVMLLLCNDERETNPEDGGRLVGRSPVLSAYLLVGRSHSSRIHSNI